MKNATEFAVWKTALRRNADPGVILTTFWLDLPFSNGRLSFCVTLDHQYRQPIAQPQRKTAGWVYSDPEPIKGMLLFPDAICRYVKRVLKENGIPHVTGIQSDNTCWFFRPENPAEYLNYQNPWRT